MAPSLQPVLGGTNFTQWSSETYQGGAGRSLNLFDASAIAQIFTTGNATFSGTAVIDMSGYLGQLPGLFTTGFVYAGNASGPGNGNALGSWEVTAVPEPTTGALLALGGSLLLRLRRNRH